MPDITNVILALRLAASLTKEVSHLVEVAQREGRDISDEELEQLRARSQGALDEWLDQTGAVRSTENAGDPEPGHSDG